MPVPETTSAEAFERYVGGKCLRVGDGKAWRDIKAWTIALPRVVDLLRKGQPDMPTLRALLQKFTALLEPYQLPEGDPLRNRPPGWIR